MKTQEEAVQIDRTLEHLAKAVVQTGIVQSVSFRYNIESDTVTVDYNKCGHFDVNVWGDSPIAVVKDVFSAFYKKVV